ncbi:FeoB-associated Cys-rich membrane protein [Fictibacillus sp. B-59209]|uniref:FeoB-associated Cys-rich membrane protein n=1 Tax=Fictibacillus sp. B-59209 TaxID=3024873 RepID=UPI002E1EF6B5|nr:FeoB-associated Cys-rich membrane protein [Fictibacillus sp. B-59209]
MLLNILLGLLIFGYAGFTIFRFVKKSKQGKCATCALKKGCQSACSDMMDDKVALSNYNK